MLLKPTSPLAILTHTTPQKFKIIIVSTCDARLRCMYKRTSCMGWTLRNCILYLRSTKSPQRAGQTWEVSTDGTVPIHWPVLQKFLLVFFICMSSHLFVYSFSFKCDWPCSFLNLLLLLFSFFFFCTFTKILFFWFSDLTCSRRQVVSPTPGAQCCGTHSTGRAKETYLRRKHLVRRILIL